MQLISVARKKILDFLNLHSLILYINYLYKKSLFKYHT